jgi:hypothetical protein
MNLKDFLARDTLQSKVFNVLQDQEWHCRTCEYSGIPSGQLAGGGGIQGLQRGTRGRLGFVIQSENRSCQKCRRITRHDRWTGETKTSNAAASISPKLKARILTYFRRTDVIEQRVRTESELVIDHRFPMERWGEAEENLNPDMSDGEITHKFQLLKKDDFGNQNLLKSRACEHCIRTGERGTPFGILFWYSGTSLWDSNIPVIGRDAERGCFGCGWYDIETWRHGLNQKLNS